MQKVAGQARKDREHPLISSKCVVDIIQESKM